MGTLIDMSKLKEVPSGTFFHKDTPDEVVRALEMARVNRQRVRLFYGDPETGKDWHEENDVTGYIGRSMGKAPLIIHNSRSHGGPALLDNCIVKIIVKGTLTPFVPYELQGLHRRPGMGHIRHTNPSRALG